MERDVKADFDYVAPLDQGNWDYDKHYHAFLLRQLPARSQSALEMGCGRGEFARRLAARCEQVQAIDLSPEMIRVAREQSQDIPNLTFEAADLNSFDLGVGRYDCMTSFATLHFFPLVPLLERFRDALAPGGTLAMVDAYRYDGSAFEQGYKGVSFVYGKLLRWIHTGSPLPKRDMGRLWKQRFEHIDQLMTVDQVRLAARVLPGAVVRRHLFRRYSIVWTKPV